MKMINPAVLVLAFGSIIFAYLVHIIQKMCSTKKWKLVGYVKQLYIYPVKSFRHQEIESAEVTKMGLKFGQMIDRHFVVSDTDGKYVTAIRYPKFVLIDALVQNNILKLSSEHCSDSVLVDLKSIVRENKVVQTRMFENIAVNGYDCGDEAGDWIAKFVSEPPGVFRLLYYFQDNDRNMGMNKFYKQYIDRPRNDKIAFPYFGTATLQCQSSLDDLNSRFTDRIFSMEIFRSNIIISGTKAYDEDNWNKVKIGSTAEFSYAMPCVRCAYIAIDPKTGIKASDLEPLRTLQQYRLVSDDLKPIFKNEPIFGVNLAVDFEGQIKIGDPVFVLYK